MDANSNSHRSAQKLPDVQRSLEKGDCVDMESPELDFAYDDCETQTSEIAELYSYSEHPEFQYNLKAFEEIMAEFNYPPSWQRLTHQQHRTVIMILLEHLDVAVSEIRMRAMRCVLYLMQGCWAEMQSDTEQASWARLNIMTLYDMGIFTVFVQLLNLEIAKSTTAAASWKVPASIADFTNLRVIFSVLYLITEHMRTEKNNPDSEYIHHVQSFKEEIEVPFGEEMLPVKLLGIVSQVIEDPKPPRIPMKKMLLLLWKILLVYLGGSKELKEQKARIREKYGLPPVTDDNVEIIKNMCASSPSPIPRRPRWKPKIHQKDIDIFLDNARMKYVGFSLPGDRRTITGLPQPIQESIKTLRKHVYKSPAEVQEEREDEITRYPLTRGEEEIEETEAEILYKVLFPNLPQYIKSLLKILLAAAPTSTNKTYSKKLMADVLPAETPKAALQILKLSLDVDRNEEIVIKAVTAILLLLLKHFKLNHIYQFEFMSQHLVSFGCIALVLKFLKLKTLSFIGAKNSIPMCDFPACVIGEQPEFTKECLNRGNTLVSYSSRNVFSCINLLRILNKLSKSKTARILKLVEFQSDRILTQTLEVRHALMQFYVLKLIKMQVKYLESKWRKHNMKTVIAILSKVRNRLNDDWCVSVKEDVHPEDFENEESILRASIDRFNQRRYGSVVEYQSELTPVDTDLFSVLNTNIELDEEFKLNYELWLEQEVYNNVGE